MREVVLASRGSGGYRQYRIPAMAVLPTGRVVVAYDARATIDDLPGPIDLVVRCSDDHGQTWSEQIPVRTGAGIDGFGDPSLLVDVRSSRLFLFYAATTKAGFFESSAGTWDSDRTQLCGLSYTDDQGETWTHSEITAMVKDGDIAAIFAASGMGIQIHSGPYQDRLIQPMVARRESGGIWATAAYSDDFGLTWQRGSLIGPANENTIAALNDGSLILHSRSNPHRLVSRSTDGGQTWSELTGDLALSDPSDNGGLARWDGAPALPAIDQDVLICCHNSDQQLRRRTMLRRSLDGGRTWPDEIVVCEGSSAYSTCVRLADGSIGVCYEREGYTEIVFAAFSDAEWRPVAPPPPLPTLELVLRMVRNPEPTEARPGDAMEILLDDGDQWNPAEWREVGAALSGAQTQRVWTREALLAALGPAQPGLHRDDQLLVSVRVTNHSDQDWAAITVAGVDGLSPEPVSVPAGASVVMGLAMHTVTQQEIDAGVCDVVAELVGAPVSAHARLRYRTADLQRVLTP